MAVGINEDKMNSFKLELMDYIQSLNLLKNRLDNCRNVINSSMSGCGKTEIINKFDNIMVEFPKVSKNINSYISTIGKVTVVYAEQDSELASQISNDISKVERLKED